MRPARGVFAISCCCAFAISVAAAGDARAEPECAGSLDGHVVDVASHEAIAGATVAVDGAVVALTDGAGRFTLAGLCPGPITVEVERVDYEPRQRTVVVDRHASLELELKLRIGETIEVRDRAPDPTELRSKTALSGAALERTRGMGLGAALADVPGVSELQSSSGLSKPIIRGQFGRRLVMLVDGVRHRAQDWGLDHAPEIDPFIADEIGVVRGAGGVRYGPDAIGGVVLVEPPELRREAGYGGEVHVIGMSNGQGGSMAARVQAAFEDVPGLAMQIEGSGKRLGAARTPDYALDNTGVFDGAVGATVGLTRGDWTSLVSYRRYQSKLGVCSCLQVDSVDEFFAQIDRREPIGVELYSDEARIERPYQGVAHDLALARTRYASEGVGAITATYAFQHDHRREYDVVRQSTTGPQYDFRLQTHEAEVVFQHNPVHLSDHWHLRGFVGATAMAQLHAYSGLTLVPDHTSLAGGVYAAERLVGHSTEVEVGARYDFLMRDATLDRRDFLRLVRSGQLAESACGGVSADDDRVQCESRYHTPTATVGVLERWTEALATKLEVSTASRAPNPDEQYLNGTSPTFPVLGLGKPDLDPETTYSTSATVTYSNQYVSAEASVYANLIDDYIYFAPAVDEDGNPIFDITIRGAFPRFVSRPVDALFYGADGGFAAKPHPAIELGGQFSLVRAENRADGSYLVFVPPDRYRGSVTVRPPDGLGLRNSFVALSSTYVTRQRRFEIAADFDDPPGAYVLVGAELGTETTIGGQTVKFALQGANLTNARYRDYTSLLRYFADEPGWQVWLRTSIFFDSSPSRKGD